MMDACRLQSIVSFDTICKTRRRSSWCSPTRRRGRDEMGQKLRVVPACPVRPRVVPAWTVRPAERRSEYEKELMVCRTVCAMGQEQLGQEQERHRRQMAIAVERS